jgi:hypothetical protein
MILVVIGENDVPPNVNAPTVNGGYGTIHVTVTEFKNVAPETLSVIVQLRTVVAVVLPVMVADNVT